jgi:hypothetical protein
MEDIADQQLNDLRTCLTRIGFNTDPLRDAMVAEGFSSIKDLGDIKMKDVNEMCKKISGLSAACRGVRIGLVLVRRFKGFVFWVRDHQHRGQVPNEEDWNLDVCKEALEAMDMEDQRKDEDSKIDPPGKLKDHEWLAWNLRLENFLNSRLGASNVPLNYISRKEIPDTYEFENDEETLIHSCPLIGPVFDSDNRMDFGIIKQALSDTPNWDWIKSLNRAQNGRATMEQLRNHFNGPGEVEKCIATAQKSMEGLHYKSESVFSFSSYITALNAAYKTLEESREPVSERMKVSTMLDGIKNQNAYLTSAIQIICTKPETKTNFIVAANELSEQIAIIFPGETRKPYQIGRGRGRQISSMRGGHRGGRGTGGGRGYSRGGRGGGYRGGRSGRGGRNGYGGRSRGNTSMDGVDVTDVTRSFTNQEWGQLSGDTRRHIHEEREKKRQRTGDRGNGNKERQAAATSTEQEEQQPDNNQNNTASSAGRHEDRTPGFGRSAYRGGRGGGRSHRT